MNGLVKATVFIVAFFNSLCALRSTIAQDIADQTVLSIELIMPTNTSNLDIGQRWGRAFEELGYSVQVRQPLFEDKIEIKERKRGSIRVVSVVGEIDRDGNVNFPGRTFSLRDGEKVKKWVEELKVYGAQGNPEGQKLWGLNTLQFEEVLTALAKPVEGQTQGKPFGELLDGLPIPESIPVKFDESVRDTVESVRTEVFDQELKGSAAGTALAALLIQHKLGFFPLRTPQGTVELTVKSLDALSNPWPVGWTIDEVTPRNKIAPQLFKFVQTGFENVSLKEVVDAIAEETGTPIVIDAAACQAKNIDPKTATVTVQKKTTAWAVVLTSIVRQARLTHELRQDEAGNAVVWITPFVPYKPGDEK